MSTKRTKLFAVLLALTSLVGWGATSARADGDLTVPVLDSFVRTSAATVSAPATITVDFTATELESTVQFVEFAYYDRLGGRHSVDQIGTTDTARGQLLADDPGGLYRLDFVAMYDSAGNSAAFRRDGGVEKSPSGASGPTTHTLDLSAGDFIYDNAAADTTIPVLDSFTRTSASPVAAPATITVDFTATELESTVQFVEFAYYDRLGGRHSVDQIGTTNTARGQLLADDPGGLYRLDFVAMYDSAGNSAAFRRDGGVEKSPSGVSGPTTHTLDLSAGDFIYDNAAADTTIPVLDSFTRTSASPVAAPATITVDFTATELESTVQFVEFAYYDRLGGRHSVDQIGTTDTARGQLLADDPGGLYRLDFVAMYDSAGNSAAFRRDGGVEKSPSGASGPTTHTLDLSAGDFIYDNGQAADADPYVPLEPVRILDTRDATEPVGPDAFIDVPVVYPDGPVPDGVRDVVLNVTATGSTDAGYLTVWPSGAARPPTSNLNFTQGASVPNVVVAHLGENGSASIYNAFGSTDVVVDVQGYFPANNAYTALPASRIVDTRPGGVGVAGPVGDNTSVDITVLGAGGVPESGVSAVVLNVTATGPTASGYMAVWPTGDTQPPTSNLNFDAGDTRANLVIAKVGGGGQISVYNAVGASDLVIDVQGYFPDGSEYEPAGPTRILDTRVATDPLEESEVRAISVVGQFEGAPAGATAVVLNVTATQSSSPGYLTLWPSGSAQPATSNLNFVAGQNVANLVVAKVGPDGKVNFYNPSGITHVIVDVVGWFPADAP